MTKSTICDSNYDSRFIFKCYNRTYVLKLSTKYLEDKSYKNEFQRLIALVPIKIDQNETMDTNKEIDSHPFPVSKDKKNFLSIT